MLRSAVRPWQGGFQSGACSGPGAPNGREFLNDQLVRFAKERGLTFTRSRPYRKNDSAHVEQKNRQYVREIVGYDRFDTPEAVQWLNRVYE